MSAEATGPVRLCSPPRSALESMARQSPEPERRLHGQAPRELDEARERMMTLGRKTAAERVASFLPPMARHADPEADGPAKRFDIPPTRPDIADVLGLTIETVSRQLTRLRKARVVEIQGAGASSSPTAPRSRPPPGA